MNKKLEEICYWKNYGTDNPICGFYCRECDGNFEIECGEYKTNYDESIERGEGD